MRGKIRYFFWSTAFSAAIMIYGAVTGSMSKTIHTLSEVRQKGPEAMPAGFKEKIPVFFHEYLPNAIKRKIPPHIWANIDRLGPNGHYESHDEYSSLASKESADQPPAPVDAAPSAKLPAADALPKQDSAAATRNDIETGRYVEIDGHYFKVSEDSIYYINGQKVYFQNNRRYSADNSGDETTQSVVDSSTKLARGPAKAAAPKAEDQIDGLPLTHGEMLETLKKAQENQRAQQELLKQLEKEN